MVTGGTGVNGLSLNLNYKFALSAFIFHEQLGKAPYSCIRS